MSYSYWQMVLMRFKKRSIGWISLWIVFGFAFVGLYAPFFASSKPLVVYFEGTWYFPLFRYLFYTGFYTKPIDLFYNLLMFTIPLALLLHLAFKKSAKWLYCAVGFLQILLFILLLTTQKVRDPASNREAERIRQQSWKLEKEQMQDPLLAPFSSISSWDSDLTKMNPYAKLNLLLQERNRSVQHQRIIQQLGSVKAASQEGLPTLWGDQKRQLRAYQTQLRTIIDVQSLEYHRSKEAWESLKKAYIPFSSSLMASKQAFLEAEKELARMRVNQRSKSSLDVEQAEEKVKKTRQAFEVISNDSEPSRKALEEAREKIEDYELALAKLRYLEDKQQWIEDHLSSLGWVVMPLLRSFHWEDDAGGRQSLNPELSWWERTRINRKDLVAALIFGVRVSLVVGITAVAFALFIGIPIGAIAGFFGGKSDLLISRFIEIWESMPTFFMLLLIVAMTQSKSIFLIVAVLGIFGWTSIARYVRGEILRQRHLTYIEACRAIGFPTGRIIFGHLLPNVIPPVITLLPFAMMSAIMSEAGLSFLGLGEEGSSSLGVLMDEGRSAFPAESYLLWPPAILLTILLIAIALVGDSLRDAIDPKVS